MLIKWATELKLSSISAFLFRAKHDNMLSTQIWNFKYFHLKFLRHPKMFRRHTLKQCTCYSWQERPTCGHWFLMYTITLMLDMKMWCWFEVEHSSCIPSNIKIFYPIINHNCVLGVYSPFRRVIYIPGCLKILWKQMAEATNGMGFWFAFPN